MLAATLTAFLNHDDLWKPNTLEALAAPLVADSQLVAAFSLARVVLSDGAVSDERTAQAWRVWGATTFPFGRIDDWFAVDTWRAGIPIIPATMFRTATGRSIRIPKIVGDSYDYWLGYRLSRLGPVFHVADALGFWREHEDNLTSQVVPQRRVQTAFTSAVIAADPRVPRAMRYAEARRIPRSLAGMVRDGGRALAARASNELRD